MILWFSIIVPSDSESARPDSAEKVRTWVAEIKREIKCPPGTVVKVVSSIEPGSFKTKSAEVYCEKKDLTKSGPYRKFAIHPTCEGFYNCPDHGGTEKVSGSYKDGKKDGQWKYPGGKNRTDFETWKSGVLHGYFMRRIHANGPAEDGSAGSSAEGFMEEGERCGVWRINMPGSFNTNTENYEPCEEFKDLDLKRGTLNP